MALDAPRVKIALNGVVVAPHSLVGMARAAEELGYESIWSGEHIALGMDADLSRYGDDPPYGPRSIFLEPFAMLAHLAAATSTLRLGIGILILPLHDPVATAKRVATVDVLSGGRLDLGIGVGWNEPEFANVGATWARRGARTDEMIEVMDVLFRDDEPEFHGEFFAFPPVGFEPKPVQKPRPPIHVGGYGPAAWRRAVHRGDGWYGHGSPEEVAPTVERLRADRVAAGLDLDRFEISLIRLDLPPDAEEIERYAAAGVDRLVITPFEDRGRPPKIGTVGDEGLVGLRAYAERIGLAPG